MTLKPAKRNAARAVAIAAASCGFVVAATVPSSAADEPTREAILADCESGSGKCTFNSPQMGEPYLGNFVQVSDTLYNCSTSDTTKKLTWTQKVGSTDSVGVSVSAGGTLMGLVNVSVTATYGHTWTSETSESDEQNVTAKPGEVAWISRAQLMQKVSGEWQTHYDSPKWGHYYWFVPDTITSPAKNGTGGKSSSIVVRSRPMTDAEKASCEANRSKVLVKQR
ncbi:hypothetical protein ACFOSC_02260 [Streptantibioticus rubrisoli]|uniref:Uncharacterized protein n=1 Tax=Streptantibioticus rubrisoli TaxID=1387313 RepID=A0ABT1PDF0_9ACTN|nr:hypothetical protein [Streptantibioticus rubrisoli]MCQ4043404.1 hypothetical protein [Streptantibioticus rubrisoli]